MLSKVMLKFVTLAAFSYQFATANECPCAQSGWPCYDAALSVSSGYARCYSSNPGYGAANDYCKPGRTNCFSATPACTVTNCDTCDPKSNGEKCQTCDNCFYKTVEGLCKPPPEAFADATVKQMGNLILVGSPSIYTALSAGMTSTDNSQLKEDATKQASAAAAYYLGNKMELTIVLPSNKIAGDYTGTSSRHYGVTGSFTSLGIRASRLEGAIAQNMLGPNYMGPFLHEIGHRWSVFLDKLMPNNKVYYSHWGFTSMETRGMMGGFDRDGMLCQSPAGRTPSPTSKCDTNVLVVDMSKGHPAVSNDKGNAQYNKLELMMMGLLSKQEVCPSASACEYLVYCELPNGPSSSATNNKLVVTCDNIYYVTADQIYTSMPTLALLASSSVSSPDLSPPAEVTPGGAILPGAALIRKDDFSMIEDTEQPHEGGAMEDTDGPTNAHGHGKRRQLLAQNSIFADGQLQLGVIVVFPSANAMPQAESSFDTNTQWINNYASSLELSFNTATLHKANLATRFSPETSQWAVPAECSAAFETYLLQKTAKLPGTGGGALGLLFQRPTAQQPLQPGN
eukprot:gb/GEZN01003383.1/.p1 GENE.gb/GEZN01003383.1/~~gb/GEZN01003383.1/.p1  ORF type:complete len:567 (+),score=83.04 gb/GEZN01003383.1/:74-1774(+)